MVARIEVKGYLSFEKGGKARLYYPAINRLDVVIAETESFLEK